MSDPIRQEFERLAGDHESLPPGPLFGLRDDQQVLRKAAILGLLVSVCGFLWIVGSYLFPRIEADEILVCQPLYGGTQAQEGPGRTFCLGQTLRYSVTGTSAFQRIFHLRDGIRVVVEVRYSWSLPTDPERISRLYEEVGSPSFLEVILRGAVTIAVAEELSQHDSTETLRLVYQDRLNSRIQGRASEKLDAVHVQMTSFQVDIKRALWN